MERMMTTDAREVYTVDETEAYEGWQEYQEWLDARDPMDAWVDSMDGYTHDLDGYLCDQPEWME